jgi:hypothetical protein
MAEATRYLFDAGSLQADSRSKKESRSGEVKWFSEPAPAIRLSAEEFEATKQAFARPQKASPALKALFNKKR